MSNTRNIVIIICYYIIITFIIHSSLLSIHYTFGTYPKYYSKNKFSHERYSLEPTRILRSSLYHLPRTKNITQHWKYEIHHLLWSENKSTNQLFRNNYFQIVISSKINPSSIDPSHLIKTDRLSYLHRNVTRPRILHRGPTIPQACPSKPEACPLPPSFAY